jgi:hypothetical protein
MAKNSSLSLVSLDFDTVKANLKTYLKTQSVFKDYDFEGSNINVLLDVLSYNTYMNSFYLNMAISEAFLDSAQLRSSVVSHAKELNYTPRSARSAKALVNLTITVTEGTADTLEIPKGTQFSGTNANGGFTYVTDENKILTSVSNVFRASDVAIYEGSYINETFIVDSSIENQRFILSNDTVDTTSINVTVSENDGLDVYPYTQKTNLYGLTNASKVFFIQATLEGSYEIIFGDGVFGKALQNQSTILVTYRVSNGAAGNGIRSFNIDKDLGAYNSVAATTAVTTVATSTDGDDIESLDSIRFRATKHYQTQDRAITVNDYINMIYENFPEIKSVSVYGGESIAGSVEYGKVFISPVSRSGTIITESIKADIVKYISDKNSIAITPVIVDPEFLYIIPTITATVNFASTNLNPADIKGLLLTTIKSYNNTTLLDFNTAFRYSKFSTLLNNTDESIESIQLHNVIKKIITPATNVSQPFTLSFNNALMPGTLLSSQFLLSDGNTYRLTDYNPENDTFVRTGSQTTYNVTNTKNTVYLRQITATNIQNYIEIGAVNYDTGKISINALTIFSFLGNPGIEFRSSTKAEDVYGIKNDSIEIDINNVNITVVSV